MNNLARNIRIEALKMVHRAKASHIGSSLSIADILAVLYGGDFLKDERGSFILSKGHACAALYAALAETGIIEKHLLETYGQNGSDLMQHVSHRVRGVEFSTGSLGHGLSFGLGKALTDRTRNVFVLLSDGEMDEGAVWEAAEFAGQHKLSNLCAIVDCNGWKGLIEAQRMGILIGKFQAFNWDAIALNGHDADQLDNAFKSLSPICRPLALIAQTVKGKGVSFMENKLEWHYKCPDDAQLEQALKELESE